MRILVVDDEKILVKGIKFNLENDGYQVDGAFDGEEGLSLAQRNRYDVILLDLMLPKMDGLEVCRRVREFSNVPVIMLTAKTGDNDKLIGFEYGADDYITKPFNIMELKARIRAILRRAGNPAAGDRPGPETRLARGPIELDTLERSVLVDGRNVVLTVKEFDLLELFMRNPGRVYSRDSLLSTVWGYDSPGDIRTVDVHIRHLREKVEANAASPEYILTKWGVGYYFKQ
ncbi:MAG: response regulator transcription factor [Ruminococcaceae bacterium]|nr:response regulator transcription factor [Oscillospiraceae bacterium]